MRHPRAEAFAELRKVRELRLMLLSSNHLTNSFICVFSVLHDNIEQEIVRNRFQTENEKIFPLMRFFYPNFKALIRPKYIWEDVQNRKFGLEFLEISTGNLC